MFEEEQLNLSEVDWQAMVSLMTYDDLKQILATMSTEDIFEFFATLDF